MILIIITYILLCYIKIYLVEWVKSPYICINYFKQKLTGSTNIFFFPPEKSISYSMRR